MNYETNATTIKLVRQRKGYRVTEGGMVYSKHYLTPRDASGYARVKQHRKGPNHGAH